MEDWNTVYLEWFLKAEGKWVTFIVVEARENDGCPWAFRDNNWIQKESKDKCVKKNATEKKYLLLIKNLNKFKQCLLLVLDYLSVSLLGRESCTATMSEKIRKKRSVVRTIFIGILPSALEWSITGLWGGGKQGGSRQCGTACYDFWFACLVAGIVQ